MYIMKTKLKNIRLGSYFVSLMNLLFLFIFVGVPIILLFD